METELMMQDNAKEEIIDLKDTIYNGLLYKVDTYIVTPQYTPIIRLEIFNITVTITDQYIKNIPSKFQRFMLKWVFGLNTIVLNEEKLKDAIRLSKSNNSK